LVTAICPPAPIWAADSVMSNSLSDAEMLSTAAAGPPESSSLRSARPMPMTLAKRTTMVKSRL